MLKPTEYYPRIGRGKRAWVNLTHRAEIVAAHRQLGLIIADLNQVLNCIEPVKENGNAYGHQIRNALIVACTEFEAQCVGVLKANAQEPIGRFYTTNDYFKLQSAMKLSEYVFTLSRHPQTEAVQPFKDWNAESPTQSIRWYDAYNKTKHDREACFQLANLSNLINAVVGCAIMYWAQENGTYPARANAFFGDLSLKACPKHEFEYQFSPGSEAFPSAIPYPF